MDHQDDVKIADLSDPAFHPQPREAEERESLLDDVITQKKNGNLKKARQLGAMLAAEVADNDGEFVFGIDHVETGDMICQRRLLLAFTISYGLDLYCPGKLTPQTATNQFYETIQQSAPHIYEDMQQEAAFSLYYLCVRDEEEVVAAVGRTFAALCGYKDDKVYCELGSALFEHFLRLVHDKAKSLQFAG